MGEDKERFEDYLELEQYIEQLQAGHVAHPPEELTVSQARIYRMAALFRSASPEAAEPRPEFAAELEARLEEELQQTQKLVRVSVVPRKQPGEEKRKSPRVSRRRLLAGGAAMAASVAIGAGIGAGLNHTREQTANGTAPPITYGTNLVGDGVSTTWHLVTTVAQLGAGAVRFATDTVVGYVIFNDGDDGVDDPDKGKIIAMSASCTHMGCIVKWQDSDRKFHCPCHGGLFTEYGKVDNGAQGVKYIYPLPRLKTKVENGKVFVEVPVSKQ